MADSFWIMLKMKVSSNVNAPQSHSYMAHLNELQLFKNQAYKRNKLQTFEAKKSKVSIKKILAHLGKEYCDISSLHCVHYLTDDGVQKFEKAIWFLILVATSIGAILTYFELADLYYTQRIQTTIMNSVHPIFYISFPSIAICARNRINYERLSAARSLFLPSNVSKESIDVFNTFFEHFEDLRFNKISHLARLFNNATTEKQLSLIKDVNVLEVVNFLSFTCEELFSDKCYWRRKSYNCCDLFTMERTEVGFCQVFNSVIDKGKKERKKNDKYYPYHNAESGESSGLEVDIILDEAKMRPGFNATNGVYIMIKQPEQWHNDARFINFNTYTKIAITAQLTETEQRARVVPVEERKCFFEDESHHPLYKKIPELLYWRGNCRTRCHQEYVVKYCNCSLSVFFPKSKQDIFSSEHHVFESEYIDDVNTESMICNCLNSCNQLIFDYYFTSVPLEGINGSDKVKMIHLDIHYQTANIIKYSTRMRFTFVELLGTLKY
ncbi:pickpocket protein 19-like [Teleopsis dalmanni]|uniref:pickpocket protein 19-like n=1 Tax=Teleopsis dalmanni TaxID=139649 RepID=UPI0018CDECB0|nr:pickpocket protein 19-like [Teleopsis dalmanni]